MNLFASIRCAAAEVTRKAQHVSIDYDRLSIYATSLANEDVAIQTMDDPAYHYPGDTPETIAYILTLGSVNFGSGYFPYLRKRTGFSGYFTIATALRDHFVALGPFSAHQLIGLTITDCSDLFEQELVSEPVIELMNLFTAALNDLGKFLFDHFEGRFLGVIETSDHCAERLIRLLASMPYFQDVADYAELSVPFYKRAQLTVSDLSIALHGEGLGYFKDLDELTIFADNMVPHVLRTDGILQYSDYLQGCIESGELLPAGSSEEIEIRACAVHASELLVSELEQQGKNVTSSWLDCLLWHRGQQKQYKALPRHRTRTVYY